MPELEPAAVESRELFPGSPSPWLRNCHLELLAQRKPRSRGDNPFSGTVRNRSVQSGERYKFTRVLNFQPAEQVV